MKVSGLRASNMVMEHSTIQMRQIPTKCIKVIGKVINAMDLELPSISIILKYTKDNG